MNPLNQCGACSRDFTSVELFDAHRVGRHAFTLMEGLEMEPMREDGRRCLDADEMTELGWVQDVKGRWLNPARVERARAAFDTAA